jgi:hypothetical protein
MKLIGAALFCALIVLAIPLVVYESGLNSLAQLASRLYYGKEGCEANDGR